MILANFGRKSSRKYMLTSVSQCDNNYSMGKKIPKHRMKMYLISLEEWELVLKHRQENNRLSNNKVKNFEKTNKTVKSILRKQTPVLSKDPNIVSNCKKLATQLNNNLPKSEQWFWTLYRCHIHIDDKPNAVIGEKIGDIVNNTYKYIIEIDGSFHNSEKQKKKDQEKDKYYQYLGYKVFRIEAYNLRQYEIVLKELLKIRVPVIVSQPRPPLEQQDKPQGQSKDR